MWGSYKRKESSSIVTIEVLFNRERERERNGRFLTSFWIVCEQVWSDRELLYRKCTKFYEETLFGSVQGGPLVWEETNKQPDPQHRCLPHITASSCPITHFALFQNNLYQALGHLPLFLKRKTYGREWGGHELWRNMNLYTSIMFILLSSWHYIRYHGLC
jgi:hypothetical protein